MDKYGIIINVNGIDRSWYMSYDLKTLSSRIKPIQGYGFITIGLVEIYNIVHSIPNYSTEHYVFISTDEDIHLGHTYIADYVNRYLRDIILNCRNNLKRLINNRIKYIVKNDTTTSSQQTNIYDGNEAYNNSKNTVKGDNTIKATQYSNTEYQDNQYLIKSVNEYMRDFTIHLSYFINNHVLKRGIYKL